MFIPIIQSLSTGQQLIVLILTAIQLIVLIILLSLHKKKDS